MEKILRELYRGRIRGWECRHKMTDEVKNIYAKIKAEKNYFSETLSPEDWKRLKQLDELYANVHHLNTENTFIYALRFGVVFMCDIFMGEEQQYDEEF